MPVKRSIQGYGDSSFILVKVLALPEKVKQFYNISPRPAGVCLNTPHEVFCE